MTRLELVPLGQTKMLHYTHYQLKQATMHGEASGRVLIKHNFSIMINT